MTPDGTHSSEIPAAPLNVSETRTPFQKPTSKNVNNKCLVLLDFADKMPSHDGAQRSLLWCLLYAQQFSRRREDRAEERGNIVANKLTPVRRHEYYCGDPSHQRGNRPGSAGLSKAEEGLGLGGKTLVALSKAIKSPEHKVLSFDNFFTSIEVLVYLRDNMHLVSLGTVRANRLRNPPLLPDKSLSKTRGAFDFCLSDSKVVVVKWADNKIVHIASTYIGVGSEPLPTVKRWCKDKGVHVQVSAPKCIAEYNQTMGGVDKFDHLCELYRMSSRAKRWYLPIFIFMLNMTLTNSWLLYKRDSLELNQKIMPSKDFRLEIYQSWVTSCVRKAGRPGLADDTIVKKKYFTKPRPLQEVRYDSYEHWPSWSCSQSRCSYCKKGKTYVTCMKCDVSLCFIPSRNCFVHFHAL
ncbi:hypothetical protein FOCC_FOCC016835 [Frankliniella occidentalis]|nr:hypothetical protein FOCC_FOCC016835 [Frankliniella occidentalis]